MEAILRLYLTLHWTRTHRRFPNSPSSHSNAGPKAADGSGGERFGKDPTEKALPPPKNTTHTTRKSMIHDSHDHGPSAAARKGFLSDLFDF